uniref:Uncharacterized protein n=1 Tax=Anopheles darlingi TaxID=43151 RepID=A0A2M4D9R7_ANODA
MAVETFGFQMKAVPLVAVVLIITAAAATAVVVVVVQVVAAASNSLTFNCTKQFIFEEKVIFKKRDQTNKRKK